MFPRVGMSGQAWPVDVLEGVLDEVGDLVVRIWRRRVGPGAGREGDPADQEGGPQDPDRHDPPDQGSSSPQKSFERIVS